MSSIYCNKDNFSVNTPWILNIHKLEQATNLVNRNPKKKDHDSYCQCCHFYTVSPNLDWSIISQSFPRGAILQRSDFLAAHRIVQATAVKLSLCTHNSPHFILHYHKDRWVSTGDTDTKFLTLIFLQIIFSTQNFIQQVYEFFRAFNHL